MLTRFWSWLISPYTKYKKKKEDQERIKKRLEEMRKHDPFIYE